MMPIATLAWALILLTTGAAGAQDARKFVDLSQGAVIQLPAQAFHQVSGLPAQTPFDEVAERLLAGQGHQPQTETLSAGMTWSKFWALTEVRNSSPAPLSRQIRTPLSAAGELDILLLRDGQAPQSLLRTTFEDPFEARPVDSRKLISAAFVLDPGERAHLAVGYRPLGFSRLPLWVQSPVQTDIWTATLGRIDAAFYTGTAVLIACFLGFCLVIRNRTGIWFAGLLVLNLLVVAQIEGHLFRFLWPQAPLFNLNATLPLILVAAGFGYLCTLQAGRGTMSLRLRFVIRLALVATGLHLAATPFAHPTLVTPGSLALWTGAFAAIAVSLPGWAQFTALQRRIGQGVSGAMILASLTMMTAALSGGAPVWSTSDIVLRLAYLFASGGLMTLLLMQVSGLYRAHQAALAAQLDASRKEAELNSALLQSERGYTDAMRRAAQAQQRLATASHDIQQPVTALRLLLQRDRGDQPEAAIAEALRYLENMAGAYTGGAHPQEDRAEVYDVGLVVRAAADMFRDEAASHGIDLNVDGAQVLTDIPTVALMRIVSNLTVNAIRHSGGQEVSLVLSATDEVASVTVTNDGAHLSAAEFARYQTHGEKGPGSDGDGLGLAIIVDLCRSHGLSLTLDEGYTSGTRLTVGLPRCA